MRYLLPFLSVLFLVSGCGDDEETQLDLLLESAYAGSIELSLDGTSENIPIDRNITLTFTVDVDPASLDDGITLSANSSDVPITRRLTSNNRSVNISTIGPLMDNQVYTVSVNNSLRSVQGATATPVSFNFRTAANELEIVSVVINGTEVTSRNRVQNVPVNLVMELEFSTPVDMDSFDDSFSISGVATTITGSNENRNVEIVSNAPMDYLRQYNVLISDNLVSEFGGTFDGYRLEVFTQVDSTYKFPEISDDELLTEVQEQTFRYFWDFAHPASGLARERNTSGDLVTIGGSGFGVMTILVGIERGFITRQQGVDRLEKIVNFLESADRFHGVWPHWMNGNTGQTIPFSADDDGADLVETAFMIQGLLAVRQYLSASDSQELAIRNKITSLWEAVEWDWFTQGENVLYWHWSPNVGFQINLPIRGWNEGLIIYVLAASSPTHPISAEVYNEGWARNGGMENGQTFYGTELPLGPDRGGPLFFSHYSFLGLDPRNLSDQYADYWEQNVAHTTINRQYCIQNPQNYVGYGETSWGLTASDNQDGYSAHSPNNDRGVITPTAAISSIPYTPEESMAAIRHFYYLLGDRIWGEYGFNDAFNITENWYASSYLAIDQGPIVIMIENHRTALLWNLFMQDGNVQDGLDKLGFTY